MRFVGASRSGLRRASSFAVRPMSRVGPPATSSVGGPRRADANESAARSATFPSSGFVSYLLRLGSMTRCLREPCLLSSLFRFGYHFVRGPLPTCFAFRNAKRAQTRLFVAESDNKVNRRWIVGKPDVRVGWLRVV